MNCNWKNIKILYKFFLQLFVHYLKSSLEKGAEEQFL